jgi:hypothetical protein
MQGLGRALLAVVATVLVGCASVTTTTTTVPSPTHAPLVAAVLAYFDEVEALADRCVALWQRKDAAGLAATPCMRSDVMLPDITDPPTRGPLFDDENYAALRTLLRAPAAPTGLGDLKLAAQDAWVLVVAFAAEFRYAAQDLPDPPACSNCIQPLLMLANLKTKVTAVHAAAP